MSKKPNRVQYRVAQCGQELTGFLYPQKFNIMCSYCRCETNCSKRHLKILNFNNQLHDAVDGFAIDLNWYSQQVKGRNKKYYCCSRCYKFILGRGKGNGDWIDRFLITDYELLTKCCKVIDHRPKTAQQASKEAFVKKEETFTKKVNSVDIRVVNKDTTKAATKSTHQQPPQHPHKKKKKSKGGGNLPQQPAKKEDKDKKAKWGQCPICHGSVKRNGRRDKNNKRYNVIGNHFSGNRQCGGSELSWDAVVVNNKKERYKVVIEEVTDGKL